MAKKINEKKALTKEEKRRIKAKYANYDRVGYCDDYPGETRHDEVNRLKIAFTKAEDADIALDEIKNNPNATDREIAEATETFEKAVTAFRTAYFEYKAQHGFGYGNFGESEYIKSEK